MCQSGQKSNQLVREKQALVILFHKEIYQMVMVHFVHKNFASLSFGSCEGNG